MVIADRLEPSVVDHHPAREIGADLAVVEFFFDIGLDSRDDLGQQPVICDVQIETHVALRVVGVDFLLEIVRISGG